MCVNFMQNKIKIESSLCLGRSPGLCCRRETKERTEFTSRCECTCAIVHMDEVKERERTKRAKNNGREIKEEIGPTVGACLTLNDFFLCAFFWKRRKIEAIVNGPKNNRQFHAIYLRRMFWHAFADDRTIWFSAVACSRPARQAGSDDDILNQRTWLGRWSNSCFIIFDADAPYFLVSIADFVRS